MKKIQPERRAPRIHCQHAHTWPMGRTVTYMRLSLGLHLPLQDLDANTACQLKESEKRCRMFSNVFAASYLTQSSKSPLSLHPFKHSIYT